MKFVKYNDNKSVTIPPAVLTVCGLDDEEMCIRDRPRPEQGMTFGGM